MSAADSHGWLIANQDRDVAEQLNDGIRLFKISTHYATQDAGGAVHTDIAAEGDQPQSRRHEARPHRDGSHCSA